MIRVRDGAMMGSYGLRIVSGYHSKKAVARRGLRRVLTPPCAQSPHVSGPKTDLHLPASKARSGVPLQRASLLLPSTPPLFEMRARP